MAVWICWNIMYYRELINWIFAPLKLACPPYNLSLARYCYTSWKLVMWLINWSTDWFRICLYSVGGNLFRQRFASWKSIDKGWQRFVRRVCFAELGTSCRGRCLVERSAVVFTIVAFILFFLNFILELCRDRTRGLLRMPSAFTKTFVSNCRYSWVSLYTDVNFIITALTSRYL